jgi:transposase
MAHPSSYPPELHKRAVRMVAEVRGDYPTESAAINAVVAKLSIGT